MTHLPVIVGFGGVNPAGRSSGHHAYRRLVIDKLGAEASDRTFAALAALMGGQDDHDFITRHTLIRKLESNLFDARAIRLNKTAKLSAPQDRPVTFTISPNQLPDNLPANWSLDTTDSRMTIVTVETDLEVMLPDTRISKVQSAGQLPTGFYPHKLYQSRNHPRGLQLTVYGASDAIQSLGINWQEVRDRVPADQIAIYASSAMGQLDANGSGGMLQSGLMGKRVSSKNLALGLAQMTADFVNAYILGSVGSTGANVGACATFLYNLRQGIEDIRSGKFRAVLVGSSEAPLTPDVIEGYRTMGALAEDEALKKLDDYASKEPDYRRACRPFAENCGFTLSEGSQFLILFDDELALEMGTNIYGCIADVFINADGFKKSIPGPGIGNYVTVGKAMGLVKSMLGEDALRNRTYMQAHGTGTPQNRVTESHIFNEMAKNFGIEKWPIAAIKSYLGHSLACAAGDQITASLGVWNDGIIPGITTVDKIADDVHSSNLDYLLKHREIDPSSMDASFINSKGFGGNNATAIVLAPHVTKSMLKKRHGKDKMKNHEHLNEAVQQRTKDYDDDMIKGDTSLIYKFGEGVIDGEELALSADKICIPGHVQDISLEIPNPYEDMT
ncbi:MAG: beta-ketoacyl synthase [Gammaproteobacteria bacterium]|nr:beta-ketoacyl synthase [Gammaproteobacteria bacterium]